MKLLHVLTIVGILSIGSFALIGCQASDPDLPANENGTAAGGNGAFGESPENPGVYQSDHVSRPSAAPDSGAGSK